MSPPPADATDAADPEPLVDPESLRDGDVPVHDDSDVVDEETVEALADLPDMAIVGLADGDRVLLRQLTETCALKLPVGNVDDGDDFAAAAREAVEEVTDFPVDLAGPEAAWRFEARLPDDDRTATRWFVVYRGSPADGADAEAFPTGEDAPADVGWYEELPKDAEALPGTDLFFG